MGDESAPTRLVRRELSYVKRRAAHATQWHRDAIPGVTPERQAARLETGSLTRLEHPAARASLEGKRGSRQERRQD